MDITIRYEMRGVITIHLDELVRCTGKREKDHYNGGTYVAFSQVKCRKLLRMILLYAEPEDVQKADDYLQTCENKKVKEIWDAERKRFEF